MRILKADGTAVTGVGNTEPEKGFCLAEGWGHSWVRTQRGGGFNLTFTNLSLFFRLKA